MAKDTKERLLEAALEIFARDGYAGTNIKDIAEAVGIVKSALYRHFESKEAIWDAVMDMVAVYYAERFGSPDRLPEIPKNTDELYSMTLKMINFTMHDRKIVLTRKLLQKEQFRDEKTRDCASNYFLYGTEAMFSRIFAAMMEQGSIRQGDAELLAFAYTTPITALLHLCDRDPDREEEVMEKVQDFLNMFIRTNLALA